METINPLEKPIFIVGVGRSGTTLLQSMINAHPEITITPETHFIRLFIGKPGIEKHIRSGKVVAMMQADPSLNRVEYARDVLAGHPIKSRQDLITYYKKILQIHAEQKQLNRIGEKDPKVIEYLRTLKEIFPDAKVIHVMRDPRDVSLSRTKADWSSNRPFITQPLTHQLQITLGRRIGPELFGDNYYEIRYEHLVSDTQAELKKICSFIEVPFNPEMMNYAQKANEVVKGKELAWKENVFKPVMRDNVNKWKKALSKRQVIAIETICKEAFNALGYERSIPSHELGLSGRVYRWYYNLMLFAASSLYQTRFN